MAKLVAQRQMQTLRIGTRIGPRGFTLLEVLIVICIIGSIAIAIPVISGRASANAQLREAALLLANDLRALQREAVERSTTTSVTILESQAAYVLVPTNELREMPSGATVTFTAQETVLARPDAITMTFSGTGVSTGGSFTLKMQDSSYTVTVAWPSGVVTYAQQI